MVLLCCGHCDPWWNWWNSPLRARWWLQRWCPVKWPYNGSLCGYITLSIPVQQECCSLESHVWEIIDWPTVGGSKAWGFSCFSLNMFSNGFTHQVPPHPLPSGIILQTHQWITPPLGERRQCFLFTLCFPLCDLTVHRLCPVANQYSCSLGGSKQITVSQGHQPMAITINPLRECSELAKAS